MIIYTLTLILKNNKVAYKDAKDVPRLNNMYANLFFFNFLK